jgi:hypothetical protein
MTATTATGTQKTTTMNEATMTHAIADLVTCANLGAKQGMDSTIDHTGAYPQMVADGGVAHTTSTQALAALKRYLESVKAEWTWAAENLVSSGDLTPQGAIHLSNGDLGYAVKRGNNPRTVQGLAYGLMKVRRTAKFAVRSAKNEAAITEAKANGGAFHAEGVDREYATEQKARKAWAREHFGADWWKEDKTNRLSQAVVQRGAPFTQVSEATEKVRAVQAPSPTPAPATTGGAVFTGLATPTPEPTPVEPVVSTEATVTLSDEVLMGMAKGAGYGSRGGAITPEGAKLYLRSKGINC